MTNVTKYEMEMVVNCNIGEQTANVYTRDKSVMQKLNETVSIPQLSWGNNRCKWR